MYVPGSQMRRSIRPGGYDYSVAGFYFVTICVQGRASLLGEILDGELSLNQAGRMAEDWWRKISDKFQPSNWTIMSSCRIIFTASSG